MTNLAKEMKQAWREHRKMENWLPSEYVPYAIECSNKEVTKYVHWRHYNDLVKIYAACTTKDECSDLSIKHQIENFTLYDKLSDAGLLADPDWNRHARNHDNWAKKNRIRQIEAQIQAETLKVATRPGIVWDREVSVDRMM